MDVKVIDSKEGIMIYTEVEGYPSQINTMYIDKEVYGVSGLYINRLIVSQDVRGKGIATKMMEKLVEIADEKKIELVLEINPYGDLNKQELEQFYVKFGFIESQLQGLYVRFIKVLV